MFHKKRKQKTVIHLPFLPRPVSLQRAALICGILIVSAAAIAVNRAVNPETRTTFIAQSVALICYALGLFFILSLTGVMGRIRRIEDDLFKKDIRSHLDQFLNKPEQKPSVYIPPKEESVRLIQANGKEKDNWAQARTTWRAKKPKDRSPWEKWFAVRHAMRLLNIPVQIIAAGIELAIGFENLNGGGTLLFWIVIASLILILFGFLIASAILNYLADKYEQAAMPKEIQEFFDKFEIK